MNLKTIIVNNKIKAETTQCDIWIIEGTAYAIPFGMVSEKQVIKTCKDKGIKNISLAYTNTRVTEFNPPQLPYNRNYSGKYPIESYVLVHSTKIIAGISRALIEDLGLLNTGINTSDEPKNVVKIVNGHLISERVNPQLFVFWNGKEFLATKNNVADSIGYVEGKIESNTFHCKYGILRIV